MRIIIETFDKQYPVIATNKEGMPLIFDEFEIIPPSLLEQYQEPIIVTY